MKKKNLVLVFIFLLSVFCQQSLCAQKITVDVRIDSSFIFIGQQAKLYFEVTQKNERDFVLFPSFSEQIQENLELVEALQIDTLLSPDNLLVVKHQYTITAFEDSLFYLAPLPFILGNDTFWSKPVSLKVIQPFYLDTVSNTITDIKPVYTPPFNWFVFFKYSFYILLLLFLLFIVFRQIRMRLHKSPAFNNSQAVDNATEVAFHTNALARLKKIKEDKAWKQGEIKKTYIELSDMLKIYCSKRFEFKATKLTSKEILEELVFLRDSPRQLYNKITAVLSTADLVKFSNYEPPEIEIEDNLQDTFLFIQQTKEEHKIENRKNNKVQKEID